MRKYGILNFFFLDLISDVPQFISSKMGNLQLLDSMGFIYIKHRTNGSKTHWECNGRRKFGCKTRFQTVEGKIIRQNVEHNHLLTEMK